ncbi:MAG TPA: type II secretion system secretin GspD [Myxococcales bacterium]|nr:type II secretion system secretin GspD [Myxococcales bacterium]
MHTTSRLVLALALCASLPCLAQQPARTDQPTPPGVPGRRVNTPGRVFNRPPQPQRPGPTDGVTRGANGAYQARPLPAASSGSTLNASQVTGQPPQTVVASPPPNLPTRATEPPPMTPVDRNDVRKNARTVVLSFDKRDLTELIQFVSQQLGRNFILPERVGGKVTLLSNAPVPIDEVWNVFVAALDANNWSVYPVGHYWKLVEKKQSPRTNIPTMLAPGEEAPPTEQMVTKLFKLRYVEADQMRNVLNFFISKDADLQIFPPDTLILSDLALNMRRLDHLIEQLDVPGGSEEIHIVSVQYAGAQELATKLTEIFSAQSTPGVKGGVQRQIGVAEPPQPGQQGVPFNPAAGPVNNAASSGPVQVSKIIAEERTNKLIVIAGAKSFARVAELIKQLDQPSGEGGVHVYYLENAKAEDVASTMSSLAQGLSSSKTRSGPGAPGAPAGAAAGGGGAASADLFSGQVKITADKNTNSLVVIASQSDYRNLVKVVERLDIRRRQVFVEAVIMEVNLENDSDFGVSAHGGEVLNNVSFRGSQGQAPIVIGSELGGLSSIGGISSLASLSGFLAGIQGPAFTVAGLSIPSFSIVLNALQSSSDVNVISTPHVIMTDNTEGEITVGQNVPFQAAYSPGATSGLSSLTAGAAGGAASSALLGLGGLNSLYAPIQRQNVELRLRIKPQINESDFVRLEVDEQTEEIASVDKVLGPTTSKRTAKTTVVAKDQETVVIGGMIQDRVTKSVQKIPVLGSLPVIGWLFRNESTKKQKTNLLLFLTPYIIRDQGDYRRIFERKMAERAEFVKRFYGDEANYETAVDYTRKLGPLSRLRRGVSQELAKVENGGPGAAGERLIGPSTRYTPPQMDRGGSTSTPAPSPAPLPADPSKAPAPGKQEPTDTKATSPQPGQPGSAGTPEPKSDATDVQQEAPAPSPGNNPPQEH